MMEISKIECTFRYKIIKKFPFLSSLFRSNSIVAKAYDKENKLLFDIKIKDLIKWL
ncbi:MAG: hypothetical protein WC720_05055 [Candidatus Shapirobacteria bacterium]